MLFIAAALLAVAAAPFEQYQVDSETTCVGPADKAFAAPDSWVAGGYRFSVSGARAEVKAQAGADAMADPSKPARVETPHLAKLGLLAAIKDFGPATRENLAQFIAAFQKAGVSAIVVDGDSAYGVDDQDSVLADLFGYLGQQGLPVFAVIGNSESRSAFNRAVLDAFRKTHNVINLDLVRRVEGDGYTVVSLPGYFDKRFIHESAGCAYSTDDVEELPGLARGAASPVVLVTHGPPRQDGKGALDATTDGKNVGDPALASAIADGKISFGVFGHILEAGGRATDLSGKKQVRQNTPVDQLFVNPGPAFSDPWALNDGHVSHGMAAILTLKGGKGEWQQLTAAPAKAKGRAPHPRRRPSSPSR